MNVTNKNYIAAHRGASKIAPENTLEAFQKAIELGADYIEFDLLHTTDGEVVVFHDINTIRMMGYDGQIRNMTLKELHELTYKNGEKILILRELVKFAKNEIGLIFDIQAGGCFEEIAKIMTNEILLKPPIYSSFIYSELLNLQSLMPDAQFGRILHKDVKSPQVLKKWVKKISKRNFYSIHPEWNAINEDFVHFAHDHNLKVFAYTINDRDGMEKLLNLGVDGLITDDISLAKEVVGRI